MDEAFELERYLPVSFGNRADEDYIAFLWDSFRTNHENEKYQFAFIAYHMLTMCAVYFNVWQIKQHLRQDFRKAIIGFSGRDLEGLVHKDDDDEVKRWSVSPFLFSRVQERSIVRLLALIGCDKSKIGCYAKLIDDRNEAAHSNGNIFYNDQTSLNLKINEILRVVAEIQTHSKPVVESCYFSFLRASQDPDTREYAEDSDQVREALIHVNYFSPSDIEVCAKCDISRLADESGYAAIESLHEHLKQQYLLAVA